MKKKIHPKEQTAELNRARLEFILRNKGEFQKLRELVGQNEKKRDEITTALASISGKFNPEMKERWDFFYKHSEVPFDKEFAEYIKKIEIPKAVNSVWRWLDYTMAIAYQEMATMEPVIDDKQRYEYLKTKVFDMYCRDAREIFMELTNGRPAVHLLMGIDLTRNKGVILQEVEKLIAEYQMKLGIHEMPEKRLKWLSIVDELLEIWDAWAGYGQRRCLSLIARKKKMPESTVKARWRLAYRLINGEEYSKEVAAESADELCVKCNDQKKCYRINKKGSMDHFPCSEYLKLTGKSYAREKLLENFDAVADQYICDEFQRLNPS